MRRLTLLLFFMLLAQISEAQSVSVLFETSKGNIKVMLYDQTPGHRDMFLSSVKKGLYNDALFNRVIRAFVTQGGDLDDSILNRERRHPERAAKRFPAELKPALFHKKGALGAGRDDNPEKASYFTQIYFVSGKLQTDSGLNAIAQKKGMQFSAGQREIYKTMGGTPHLDGDYTVFGEITEGLEVMEAINNTATNEQDVPQEPIIFHVKLLKKRRL